MRFYFRLLVLPLGSALCSLFSGGALAGFIPVFELVQAAFPAPVVLVRQDAVKPLPVRLPVLFDSGHGLFASVRSSLAAPDFSHAGRHGLLIC